MKKFRKEYLLLVSVFFYWSLIGYVGLLDYLRLQVIPINEILGSHISIPGFLGIAVHAVTLLLPDWIFLMKIQNEETEDRKNEKEILNFIIPETKAIVKSSWPTTIVMGLIGALVYIVFEMVVNTGAVSGITEVAWLTGAHIIAAYPTVKLFGFN